MELWLHDLVRGGIAQVQNKPAEYWKEAASRLVDAQAASLARQVRALSKIPGSSPDWPERLLIEISELHLLIQAYKQYDSLTPGTQSDAKWAVGWTLSEAALKNEPRVRDRWLVLGMRVQKHDRMQTRRTYLLGLDSGRFAMVLEHRTGRTHFETIFEVGFALKADLVFYPSNDPLRAFIAESFESTYVSELATTATQISLRDGLSHFGHALTRNPWQDTYGLLLSEMVFVQREGEWFIADNHGEWLAVSPKFSEGWRLLAFSGGHPVTIAVEWDGTQMWPLAAFANGQWVDLQPKKVR